MLETMVRFANDMDAAGARYLADVVTGEAERFAQLSPVMQELADAAGGAKPQRPTGQPGGSMCPPYSVVRQRLNGGQVGGVVVWALFRAPNVVKHINPQLTRQEAIKRVTAACNSILAAMGDKQDMSSIINYLLGPDVRRS